MTFAESAYIAIMGIPLLYCAFCILYLLRLSFHALLLRRGLPPLSPPKEGDAFQATPPLGNPSRFVLFFPAHNEELILAAVLDGLRHIAYPSASYRVVVIADNCTDGTAEIARSKGVLVWERANPDERGKGYALNWAIDRLLRQENASPDPVLSGFDGIVVCDADTILSPNLLQAFHEKLSAGGQVLQARYEVLNSDESWRTRLMSCALALVHIVKPLGREHLRLSEGLKGNGMAFSREVVERIPWSGASITEDIEYSLRLCREGYRVQFVPGAAVWAQMPVTAAQSKSQRQRWEGGRYRLLVSLAPRLLAESLRTSSRILRDRAIEMFIPPFAEMFALPILLLGLNLAASRVFHSSVVAFFTVAWALVLVLQGMYLVAGLWIARVPAKIAVSLLGAPFYIAWKFGVYGASLAKRSGGGWNRTERRKL